MAFNTIEQSLIFGDINRILKNTNKKYSQFHYEVYLHTPELDYELTQLISVEYMRNFNDNVGDHVTISANVPAGLFVKRIYPFRDVLEVSISKVFPKGNFENINTRYKFVLTNNTGAIEGSRYSNDSEAELDKKEAFKIEGQCVDRELIGIMNQPVKGFQFKESPEKLIPGIIVSSIKGMKIEGKPLKIKFDMVKPDNKDKVELMIPAGMNAVEIPTYTQMCESGGVYNHGIGCYFWNKMGKDPTFFVYPLFSPHRYYNSAKGKKLLFFYTGLAKYDNVENTYLEDGDLVMVLANSQSQAIDKGETELINTGDSVMIPSQKGMNERNIELGSKSVAVDVAGSASSHGVKKRRDGFNIVKAINTRNTCKYFSGLNEKSMTQYKIVWHFADPDLVYPGMPCCYIYQDKIKGVVKLSGQVQAIYYRYAKEKKTISAFVVLLVQNPAFYADQI